MPAPTKSARPTSRPRSVEREAEARRIAREQRAMDNNARYNAEDMMLTQRRAKGGKVKKMAMGGMCRGMGKATKGGNYSKNG